jgi:hypothetical protein
MTEDTDLAKRVCELEERVSYLEHELEMSVDEKRFERRMSRICPGDKVQVDTDGFNYTAEVVIHPEELPRIAQEISSMEGVGWRIKKSREGSITIEIEEGLIQP